MKRVSALGSELVRCLAYLGNTPSVSQLCVTIMSGQSSEKMNYSDAQAWFARRREEIRRDQHSSEYADCNTLTRSDDALSEVPHDIRVLQTLPVNRTFSEIGSRDSTPTHAAGSSLAQGLLERRQSHTVDHTISEQRRAYCEAIVPPQGFSQPAIRDAGPPPTPEEPPSQDIRLSAEQQRVVQLAKQGRNVFFTGPAGTGKSVVMREIIAWAREEYKTKACVAVTAPTGIAAKNVGGRSIHSWAGIGLGKEDAPTLAKQIAGTPTTAKRWTDVKMLIIDEISMVNGVLFDKLEHIARHVRQNDAPFGGIQLVITGDFFQLPPVGDKSFQYQMKAIMAFQSRTWSRCITRPIFLKQVFRQTDSEFVDLLAAMRHGRLTEQHHSLMISLQRSITSHEGIEASQLYPLRAEVAGYNTQRLSQIDGEGMVYKSIDNLIGYDRYGKLIPEASAKLLLEDSMAPENLHLKVGAQVMLIKNMTGGHLVNGDIGIVKGFLSVLEAVDYHLDILGVDTTKPKFHGDKETVMIEIAKQLKLADKNLEWREPEKTAKGFDVEERWPFVHFGDSGQHLLCTPQAFDVMGPKGNREASRSQVPLILAWAISIHKSQGQTLKRVKVDLGRVFERGQAYVAISRATSLAGLEVVNFDPAKIMVDPLVLAWHNEMVQQENFDEEFESQDAVDRFTSTMERTS